MSKPATWDYPCSATIDFSFITRKGMATATMKLRKNTRSFRKHMVSKLQGLATDGRESGKAKFFLQQILAVTDRRQCRWLVCEPLKAGYFWAWCEALAGGASTRPAVVVERIHPVRIRILICAAPRIAGGNGRPSRQDGRRGFSGSTAGGAGWG